MQELTKQSLLKEIADDEYALNIMFHNRIFTGEEIKEMVKEIRQLKMLAEAMEDDNAHS